MKQHERTRATEQRALLKSWAVTLFGLWGAAGIAPLVAQEPLLPDSVVYDVTRRSRLEVKVGKAGLLAPFFGHEHRFRAIAFSGTVVYVPQDPRRSRVAILVRADSLELISEANSADAAEIVETMRSEVLAVDRFPEIRFVSREVRPRPDGLEVAGDFTLVGVSRSVTMQARLEATPSELTATTRFRLRQSDFGIEPYATALGTIKVSDWIDFEIELIGMARNPGPLGQTSGAPLSVRSRIQ